MNNFLDYLPLNKKISKNKDNTLGKIVELFKNNEQQFNKFEDFYKNNVLTEISDNYFEINSRQASEDITVNDCGIDYELVNRIVNELVDGNIEM